jgi:hypothetical protein
MDHAWVCSLSLISVPQQIKRKAIFNVKDKFTNFHHSKLKVITKFITLVVNETWTMSPVAA